MMVQGGSRDSLPCDGVNHSILGLDGVVDEDLLMRMLSRNGVNIAGTKAFDYLLSKLKGPEDSDANEELDIESLTDLEFLKDSNKRKDFQNSIENLLKDFGDLDSCDGDHQNDAEEPVESRTGLSRRPSVHPSRDTPPSIPKRRRDAKIGDDGRSPHSNLLKILEGVVNEVQKESGHERSQAKRRSSSRPKQRKSRCEEGEKERDRASRPRKKSVGRASERSAPPDESSRSVKSRGTDKARGGDVALHRSSHKKSGAQDGSMRRERSSTHRHSDPDMGRKSGHSSKHQKGNSIRRESDSNSSHHSPMDSRRRSSSSHRSSQHSVSSRNSSLHERSRRSSGRSEAAIRESHVYNSNSGLTNAPISSPRTPLAKTKARTSMQTLSPETAVTYEFDQEESESSFACSSYRSSPAQVRGRRASSPVARRGRSRSASRALTQSVSRHLHAAATQPEGDWILPSRPGHEEFAALDFDMRDETIVSKTRNTRRCRSVEPSRRRSSIGSAAYIESPAIDPSAGAYPGAFELPAQDSIIARRRSSIGSTLSCSTPAQRRRSMGSSSIVSLPHGFTSRPHRQGSIDSTSMASSGQFTAHHLAMDGSSFRSASRAFPPVATRRNSMDSLSISSMPHLYGGVAQRRSSLNGGLMRSPSSMSVSSRVSNVSGLTAQSAPAHLYRSPTASHPSALHQVYPTIRPPPQAYPASRRGSSSGIGGGGFGAGEARRRARVDPAASDPFFSVSAFGHSSTDPFRAARRASLY